MTTTSCQHLLVRIPCGIWHVRGYDCFTPYLVWEALWVDARACPAAAAGDPFALPAQEQAERNKKSFMLRTFHFHCYWWVKNKRRNNKWKGMYRTRSCFFLLQEEQEDHKTKRNEFMGSQDLMSQLLGSHNFGRNELLIRYSTAEFYARTKYWLQT